MLFCAGAWVPRNNQDQWIQADLLTTHRIKSVTTQGRPRKQQDWVTSYYVSYSQDGTSWEEISTLFEANEDRDTKRTNLLPDNIEARYIRLSPNSWNSRIGMRFDVAGCAVKGWMSLYALVTIMFPLKQENFHTPKIRVWCFFSRFYSRKHYEIFMLFCTTKNIF